MPPAVIQVLKVVLAALIGTLASAIANRLDTSKDSKNKSK